MSVLSKFENGAISVLSIILKTIRYAAEEALGVLATQKQPDIAQKEEKEEKTPEA